MCLPCSPNCVSFGVFSNSKGLGANWHVVFRNSLGHVAGSSKKVLWRAPPNVLLFIYVSQFHTIFWGKWLVLQKRFFGSRSCSSLQSVSQSLRWGKGLLLQKSFVPLTFDLHSFNVSGHRWAFAKLLSKRMLGPHTSFLQFSSVSGKKP